jgi:hypothetical protein
MVSTPVKSRWTIPLRTKIELRTREEKLIYVREIRVYEGETDKKGNIYRKE